MIYCSIIYNESPNVRVKCIGYLMIYYINENIGYLKMALFGSEALFVRFLNCFRSAISMGKMLVTENLHFTTGSCPSESM